MQVFAGRPGAGGQQSAEEPQRSLVFEHFGISEVHEPTGSPNSVSGTVT